MPHTYSQPHRHFHGLSESWFGWEGSFLHKWSPVAGIQIAHLTRALLNDCQIAKSNHSISEHSPSLPLLYSSHTDTPLSASTANHQHLQDKLPVQQIKKKWRSVAGLGMPQPKSPAPQLSLVLAKQWMAGLIPVTAHTRAPKRPQSFLGLDCHIRQS